MDYLTARWFLVKNLSENKIKVLHSIENAAYKYSLYCKKNYKKNKVIPPLWWQSGLSSLSDYYVEFWQYCETPSNLRQANYSAMLIRSILTARGADLTQIFSDISLMHKCDLLVKTLPFTYHASPLSLHISSSKTSLA